MNVSVDISGLPFNIVSRDEWGALPAKAVVPADHPFQTIVFYYYTGVHPCYNRHQCTRAMRKLQSMNMEEGLSDVAYHFLLGNDKNVYEGRGWLAKSSRSLEYDQYYNKRFDIGWIGDYMGPERNVKKLTKNALELINLGFRMEIVVKYHDIHKITEQNKLRKLRKKRL